MPRLIAALVRHGDYHQLPDTPSAHQPFSLTEKGISQAIHGAKLIADMARDQGWRLHRSIHCSNLQRGYQTAKIIAGKLDGDFQVTGHDDLAERGLGSAANLSIDQINKILADDSRFDAPPENWKSDSHYRLPLQGAESLIEAGGRVAGCLRGVLSGLAETLSDGPDEMVVFVGHGAAFRHAAYHLGVLTFDDIARLSMYHGVPVALAYEAGSPWQHLAGDWKIRAQEDGFSD